MGTAIELDNESEFDAFSAATGVMASYFALAETLSGWMARRGVAPDNAQAFVSQMFQGLAGTSPAAHGGGFAALAEEHQTRGGLNEQVLKSVTDDGVFAALERALDAVFARVTGAPRG